jgi:hypothetical protein
MVGLMSFLDRLFRRTGEIRQSPEDRAESDAQEAARKYWKRKVAEEGADLKSSPPSKAETAAEKSAREYWKREVAEEKVRRGTGETPPER